MSMSKHVRFQSGEEKGRPLELMLLIDQSGSVTDEQLVHALNFGKALSWKVLSPLLTPEGAPTYDPEKHSRMGVVAYASAAVVTQPLTSSMDEVKVALQQPRQRGSTATASALTKALSELNRDGRPKAQKIIVLVTDGCPNNCDATTEAADAAKKAGALLFCVSVGPSVPSHLKSLASLPADNYYLKAETFESLPRVMKQILGTLKGMYSIHVLEFASGTVAEGCRNVPIVITNKSGRDLTDVELHVTETGSAPSGECFEAYRVALPNVLRPSQQVVVPIHLVPFPGRSLDELMKQGGTFKFSLVVGQRDVYSCDYQFSFKAFNRGIDDMKVKPRPFVNKDGHVTEMDTSFYNAVVVGRSGTGKSSVINTLATAASDSPTVLKDITTYGNGTGHCTKTLDLHANLPGLSKLRIYDTKGLERQLETSTPVLTRLLRGFYPKGWNFVDNKWEDLSEDEKSKFKETAPLREADAVIFCVPADDIVNQDQDTFSALRRQMEGIGHLHHNVIVLLTKIDLEFPDLKDAVYDKTLKGMGEQTVSDLVEQAKRLLGVNRVLYIVNYTDETHRNFGIDALAFKAAMEIQKCCKTRRRETSVNSSKSLQSTVSDDIKEMAARVNIVAVAKAKEVEAKAKEEAKQARENENARKKEELEELRQNMEREKLEAELQCARLEAEEQALSIARETEAAKKRAQEELKKKETAEDAARCLAEAEQKEKEELDAMRQKLERAKAKAAAIKFKSELEQAEFEAIEAARRAEEARIARKAAAKKLADEQKAKAAAKAAAQKATAKKLADEQKAKAAAVKAAAKKRAQEQAAKVIVEKEKQQAEDYRKAKAARCARRKQRAMKNVQIIATAVLIALAALYVPRFSYQVVKGLLTEIEEENASETLSNHESYHDTASQPEEIDWGKGLATSGFLMVVSVAWLARPWLKAVRYNCKQHKPKGAPLETVNTNAKDESTKVDANAGQAVSAKVEVKAKSAPAAKVDDVSKRANPSKAVDKDMSSAKGTEQKTREVHHEITEFKITAPKSVEGWGWVNLGSNPFSPTEKQPTSPCYSPTSPGYRPTSPGYDPRGEVYDPQTPGSVKYNHGNLPVPTMPSLELGTAALQCPQVPLSDQSRIAD